MYGMGATTVPPEAIPTASEKAAIESLIGKINPATGNIYYLEDIARALNISPAKVEYQMFLRQMQSYNATPSGQMYPQTDPYEGGSAYINVVHGDSSTGPSSGGYVNPVGWRQPGWTSWTPNVPVPISTQPPPTTQPVPPVYGPPRNGATPSGGFSIPFWVLAVGAAFLLIRK